MTRASSTLTSEPSIDGDIAQRDLSTLREELQLGFGVRFAVLDVAAGEFLRQGDLPLTGRGSGNNDPHVRLELCRAVLQRGRPDFIAEEDPIGLLALPLMNSESSQLVALAPFVLRETEEAAVAEAALILGACPHETPVWARRQTVWKAQRLLWLADTVVANWNSQDRQRQAQREIDDLSSHLAVTYEEISLLYRLTQSLKISATNESMGHTAMEWLAEAIPAEGFALVLLPQMDQAASGEMKSTSQPETTFITHCQCPVDKFEFAQLLEAHGLNDHIRPLLVNVSKDNDGWPLPAVRQAVVAPLVEGDNLFGWIAAFNHTGEGEFGSSEANLLASVGSILGIHAGNMALYRRQGEFLAGVVRALTSAIDAKDPYTCGHSDRVARVAVQLASHIGCTQQELETIYLSGLLHDIGKIGIDDQVLRKPGKLTEAEYEHIKLHAEIGYRILKDIHQLDEVLPVVRHHHESWDGAGYPFGLSGEEIPLFARIVAVADAFDAMSSDRPYRKGMPDEQLDRILQNGAGKQWDARIVEAFFAGREEIRRIAHTETEPFTTEIVGMS